MLPLATRCWQGPREASYRSWQTIAETNMVCLHGRRQEIRSSTTNITNANTITTTNSNTTTIITSTTTTTTTTTNTTTTITSSSNTISSTLGIFDPVNSEKHKVAFQQGASQAQEYGTLHA